MYAVRPSCYNKLVSENQTVQGPLPVVDSVERGVSSGWHVYLRVDENNVRHVWVADDERPAGRHLSVDENDDVEWTRPTATAGEIIAHLSNFDPATPVTVMNPDGSWWLNVDGASDPNETGEQSIVLHTRDDFDTRQW